MPASRNSTQRIGEIEGRRRKLVEEMNEQHGETEMLEDDAFEAQEEEERRRNEWIVEREIESLRSHPSMMAWTRGGEDDQRFRKTLGTALLVCLLFALIVPFIKLPLLDLREAAEPYAKHDVIVMLPKEALPPPPPLPPKPREKLVQSEAEARRGPGPSSSRPRSRCRTREFSRSATSSNPSRRPRSSRSLGAKAQINVG